MQKDTNNDEQHKENPNYWSVIPATIKYDERLTDFAKILYAEIMSLSNKDGYCYARNSYFEGAFNKSNRTVTRNLTLLEECGLVEFENRDSLGGMRKIYPLMSMNMGVTKVPEPLTKVPKPPTKMAGTPDKNGVHNNIYNNIKNNKDNTIEKEAEEKKVVEGRNKLTRVVSLYGKLWHSRYGIFPSNVNYGHLGAKLKPLLDNHSEYQIALFLLQYFEWHGEDGCDTFIHKRLANNSFPLLWLPTYIDGIKVFLSNGQGIDLNKEKVVEKIVDDKLKALSIK